MNKNKLLLIIILIGIIITLLTGCKENNKKCLESHNEIKHMYFFNGRTMIYIPVNRTVCDKYEGE